MPAAVRRSYSSHHWQTDQVSGVGEKTEALEPFHPDRIASRILGMGDVLSLIEDIESKVDRAQAEKLASKLKKGDGFDLNDFLEQLRQMKIWAAWLA